MRGAVVVLSFDCRRPPALLLLLTAAATDCD